jgi:hypothetical protein
MDVAQEREGEKIATERARERERQRGEKETERERQEKETERQEDTEGMEKRGWRTRESSLMRLRCAELLAVTEFEIPVC